MKILCPECGRRSKHCNCPAGIRRRRPSRLMQAPDHDLIDPAQLRNAPCAHCGSRHWVLERSTVDPSAFRIRCASGLCGRVLVAAQIPRRMEPTGTAMRGST